jgi:hypothetical protein
MTFQMKRERWSPVLLLFAIGLSGCGQTSFTPSEPTMDVAMLQQHRQRWMLTEEPVGAMSLSELRQMFSDLPKEAAKSEIMEVTVVGKVGALSAGDKDTDENPLWVKGSAQFRLLDQAAASEDIAAADGHASHGHDPNSGDHSECEFCKKMKAAQAPVIVQLLDESKSPLPLDARTLLSLKGNDEMIVQGLAQLQAGSILVNAQKVFIRSSDPTPITTTP